MNGDGVQNIALRLPMSHEALSEAIDLFALATAPDTRTRYQRERDQIAAEARGRKARAEVREAHAAALRGVESDTIRAVLELHGPAFYDGLTETWAHCDGCDAGSYAEDAAEWPCSTYELITGQR